MHSWLNFCVKPERKNLKFTQFDKIFPLKYTCNKECYILHWPTYSLNTILTLFTNLSYTKITMICIDNFVNRSHLVKVTKCIGRYLHMTFMIDFTSFKIIQSLLQFLNISENSVNMISLSLN